MTTGKLEELARECVGDDKTDLYFVTNNGVVRAVFIIATDAEKFAVDNRFEYVESKRGCFSPEEFISENY